MSDCGCKIMCDCSEYKDSCDCNCGSPFTCSECEKKLEAIFGYGHISHFKLPLRKKDKPLTNTTEDLDVKLG